MKISFYPLLLLLLAAPFSCVSPPEYPDEPMLIYNTEDGDGFNKNVIVQGSPGNSIDTLILTFSFTDGDGNIGNDVDSFDIFYTDSRDGFRDMRRLPIVPDEGTGNGIEGKIILRFPNQPFNICCTYDDGSPSCQPHPETDNPAFDTDTFSYTLQIRDQANNWSNMIQTETVTILCE
jgi:hypothetical protein